MSKVGRKIIDISGLTVDAKGNTINYKGPHGSGSYELPVELTAQIEGESLQLVPAKIEGESAKSARDLNRIWGLHRALLSNELSGAKKEFEKNIEIVGLGFKAAITGNKMVFTLGYSHKIDYEIPAGVTVTVDKSGQKLVI